MPCSVCVKRNMKNCQIKHNARTCVFNPESKSYIHSDKYPLLENVHLELWGVPKNALWWGYQERAKERAKKEAEKPVVVSEEISEEEKVITSPDASTLPDVPEEWKDDLSEIKCWYCNSRGVDFKNEEGVWIHTDCE